MREKFPEIHFQSMVKLALVHRVEHGQPKEFDKPRDIEPRRPSRFDDNRRRARGHVVGDIAAWVKLVCFASLL
jgi:hypothetical protein